MKVKANNSHIGTAAPNMPDRTGNTNNTKIEELENSVIDLQCRSMKNNLIFRNLIEHREEDTEQKLRMFLHQELGIEHHIAFGNVHRFGKRTPGKRRPIVARFIHYKDLRLVLERAPYLRDTPYGISEQFPKIVEEKRKVLYPVLKQAKRNGKNASLVRDKLFINGKLYAPENVQEQGRDVDSETDQNTSTGYRDRLVNQPPVTDTPDNRGRYKRRKQYSSSSTPEHVNSFYG